MDFVSRHNMIKVGKMPGINCRCLVWDNKAPGRIRIRYLFPSCIIVFFRFFPKSCVARVLVILYPIILAAVFIGGLVCRVFELHETAVLTSPYVLNRINVPAKLIMYKEVKAE